MLLQGTRGTTLFAAPLGTAALHDRLFAANRCPCNGGHPSEPTCVFSPAAQGPVTETLCTRLAPPGGSLYAEENRFFPVNAFALCSKWFHFSKTRRPCQAVLLTMKMKRFHINSSINFQNLQQKMTAPAYQAKRSFLLFDLAEGS